MRAIRRNESTKWDLTFHCERSPSFSTFTPSFGYIHDLRERDKDGYQRIRVLFFGDVQYKRILRLLIKERDRNGGQRIIRLFFFGNVRGELPLWKHYLVIWAVAAFARVQDSVLQLLYLSTVGLSACLWVLIQFTRKHRDIGLWNILIRYLDPRYENVTWHNDSKSRCSVYQVRKGLVVLWLWRCGLGCHANVHFTLQFNTKTKDQLFCGTCGSSIGIDFKNLDPQRYGFSVSLLKRKKEKKNSGVGDKMWTDMCDIIW